MRLHSLQSHRTRRVWDFCSGSALEVEGIFSRGLHADGPPHDPRPSPVRDKSNECPSAGHHLSWLMGSISHDAPGHAAQWPQRVVIT